jgi:hypothetical protein
MVTNSLWVESVFKYSFSTPRIRFESVEGQTIPPFKVNKKTANLLQKFIVEGGFALEE